VKAGLGMFCLAVLLLPACAGDGGPFVPPDEPLGRWYAGDFHVHTSEASNDTRYPDGSLQSFPDTIRDTARNLGMSFVVLTDHSNSAGSIVDSTVEDGNLWNRGPEFPLWETAADLSSPDFLMIDGSELSPVSNLDADQCVNCPTTGSGELTPVGHVGCVPEDLRTFDRDGAFVDRPPGEVPGGSGVEQCQARGGFAIINHPFIRATPWIEYDWTNFDYDAVEVWNGSAGYAAFDLFAYDAYLCDRLAGRDVVAVGGSDNHRTPIPYTDAVTTQLGAPLGLPMTSVFAESLDWDLIMEAVRGGRVVIHERGTFVEFFASNDDGFTLGRIGDTITAPEGNLVVGLRGTSPRAQELTLFHVGPDGCVDRRQPGRDLVPLVQRTAVFSAQVCGSGTCTFAERATLVPREGLYFAAVGNFVSAGLNVRDVAVTNVLTVNAATAG
jgi:hypothetical protein